MGCSGPDVRRGRLGRELALGGPGRGSGEGGRGAPDRWSAGRVLEHRAVAGGPRGSLRRDLPPMLARVTRRPPREIVDRSGACSHAREDGRRHRGDRGLRHAGAVAVRVGPVLHPRRVAGRAANDRRRDSGEPVARPAGTASGTRSTASAEASRCSTSRSSSPRRGAPRSHVPSRGSSKQPWPRRVGSNAPPIVRGR